MAQFDTLLLQFTLFLPLLTLRCLCDWGNGPGDVNIDVEGTCSNADGNGVSDDNDPDDTDIEGFWTEHKLLFAMLKPDMVDLFVN